MLLSLIRLIRAFRDHQRNVAELSQLSDRELADMGLYRSDISRVATGNYTADPQGARTIPSYVIGHDHFSNSRGVMSVASINARRQVCATGQSMY